MSSSGWSIRGLRRRSRLVIPQRYPVSATTLVMLLGLGSPWLNHAGAQGQLDRRDTKAPNAAFCQQWDRKLANLSAAEVGELRTVGALWSGDLFVTPRFAPDCEFRSRLGEYWGKLILGHPISREEAKFGSTNSRRIVAVLEKVWPIITRPDFGDGTFWSDRYSLLADPNLSETDLTPFIARTLRKDGIGFELAWVLMDRPLRGVAEVLSDEYDRAQRRQDFPRMILALACLQKAGRDVSSKLDELVNSSRLRKEQKTYIENLRKALAARGSLTFADVEDIQYGDLISPRKR